jgi:hypothetical protein
MLPNHFQMVYLTIALDLNRKWLSDATTLPKKPARL